VLVPLRQARRSTAAIKLGDAVSLAFAASALLLFYAAIAVAPAVADSQLGLVFYAWGLRVQLDVVGSFWA